MQQRLASLPDEGTLQKAGDLELAEPEPLQVMVCPSGERQYSSHVSRMSRCVAVVSVGLVRRAAQEEDSGWWYAATSVTPSQPVSTALHAHERLHGLRTDRPARDRQPDCAPSEQSGHSRT